LLEEELRRVYNSNEVDSDSYTVVVGPKGAGKSSLVAHVFGGQPGVLRVDVLEADNEVSILNKLLRTSGTLTEQRTVNADLGILLPFFMQAAEKAGRRISIVLEVERGSSSDGVLYMVKSAAKKLAFFANVVVVLSEANAGLFFGDDLSHHFLGVAGMTPQEATAYAKMLLPAVTDADLAIFFDRVGTFPLQIREFSMALMRSEPATDYINKIVTAAESDLGAFEHTPIITALQASPDGVPKKIFRGVKHNGINLAAPREVAMAMKKACAVMFHFPSYEYRLVSRAHRTALVERWEG